MSRYLCCSICRSCKFGRKRADSNISDDSRGDDRYEPNLEDLMLHPNKIDSKLEQSITAWQEAINEYKLYEDNYLELDDKNDNLSAIIKDLRRNPEKYLSDGFTVHVRKLAEKKMTVNALQLSLGMSIEMVESQFFDKQGNDEDPDSDSSEVHNHQRGGPMTKAISVKLSVLWANRLNEINPTQGALSMADGNSDRNSAFSKKSSKRISRSSSSAAAKHSSLDMKIRPKWPDFLIDTSYDVVKVNRFGQKMRRTLKLTQNHVIGIKNGTVISKFYHFNDIRRIWLENGDTIHVQQRNSKSNIYLSPIAAHILQQITTRVQVRTSLDRTEFRGFTSSSLAYSSAATASLIRNIAEENTLETEAVMATFANDLKERTVRTMSTDSVSLAAARESMYEAVDRVVNATTTDSYNLGGRGGRSAASIRLQSELGHGVAGMDGMVNADQLPDETAETATNSEIPFSDTAAATQTTAVATQATCTSSTPSEEAALDGTVMDIAGVVEGVLSDIVDSVVQHDSLEVAGAGTDSKDIADPLSLALSVSLSEATISPVSTSPSTSSVITPTSAAADSDVPPPPPPVSQSSPSKSPAGSPSKRGSTNGGTNGNTPRFLNFKEGMPEYAAQSAVQNIIFDETQSEGNTRKIFIDKFIAANPRRDSMLSTASSGSNRTWGNPAENKARLLEIRMFIDGMHEYILSHRGISLAMLYEQEKQRYMINCREQERRARDKASGRRRKSVDEPEKEEETTESEQILDTLTSITRGQLGGNRDSSKATKQRRIVKRASLKFLKENMDLSIVEDSILVFISFIIFIVVEEAIFLPLKHQIIQLLPNGTSMEEENALVAKMKAFSSRSQQQWGVPDDLVSPLGWQSAIFELAGVEHNLTPSSQLHILTRTVKAIYTEFKLVVLPRLQAAGKHDVYIGADDLVPIFMYVFCQSNLKHPMRNRDLMWSLCHPDQLHGEGGYYLTVYESSIEYIGSEELTSESFVCELEENAALRTTVTSMAAAAGNQSPTSNPLHSAININRVPATHSNNGNNGNNNSNEHSNSKHSTLSFDNSLSYGSSQSYRSDFSSGPGRRQLSPRERFLERLATRLGVKWFSPRGQSESLDYSMRESFY